MLIQRLGQLERLNAEIGEMSEKEIYLFAELQKGRRQLLINHQFHMSLFVSLCWDSLTSFTGNICAKDKATVATRNMFPLEGRQCVMEGK